MRFIKAHIKVLLVVLLLLPTFGRARAQFLDSASGLLQAPSAVMNPSGTFMITTNWINSHATPPFPWEYDTFGYGINITFWSRLEVGYVMTIIDGRKLQSEHPYYWKIMINQDRHFYAKFSLLKEGEFGWKWTPALAIGVSDPTTGAGDNDYTDLAVSGMNGYFNRLYLVFSKHFSTPLGEFGLHAGYQYNVRSDYPIDGPCGGINWRPKWVQNDWIKLNLIAEYDSRTFNAGLVTSIYKDHFDIMVEWQNLQWFSWGIRYKLVLF